jgi:hypothetical protein
VPAAPRSVPRVRKPPCMRRPARRRGLGLLTRALPAPQQ